MRANGSQSPVPGCGHVTVETRRGQGSLALVLLADNDDTSCIRAGDGTCTYIGLLTQIPACYIIVIGSSSLALLCRPSGLNSLLVNRRPLIGWVGRHLSWRIGAVVQAVSMCVRACVCVGPRNMTYHVTNP